MKVDDDIKLEMIFVIDKFLLLLKGSIYEQELKQLRCKYIYKDICCTELKKDMAYIKDIEDMMMYYYERQKRYETEI